MAGAIRGTRRAPWPVALRCSWLRKPMVQVMLCSVASDVERCSDKRSQGGMPNVTRC